MIDLFPKIYLRNPAVGVSFSQSNRLLLVKFAQVRADFLVHSAVTATAVSRMSTKQSLFGAEFLGSCTAIYRRTSLYRNRASSRYRALLL